MSGDKNFDQTDNAPEVSEDPNASWITYQDADDNPVRITVEQYRAEGR